MERTKLNDRKLPNYTKGEEIFNMVSHIVGVALGITALVLCTIMSVISKDIYAVISSIIYGASIILLYTMSSLYHGLSKEITAKKVFQILDHCSIFLLIAGTYTPFSLVMLREYDAFTGWMIFSVVWGVAIIGIILNSIDIKKYKVLSMICYLAMGWCILVKINLLPKLLGNVGFWLLLSGGIIYSLGAILYGVGKKKKYMHSIFHLFVLVATILHFLCILFYVI